MSKEPKKSGHFMVKMATEQAKACAQIITAMSVKELRMILMTIVRENDIELASYLIDWQEKQWKAAEANAYSTAEAIKQQKLLFKLEFGEK